MISLDDWKRKELYWPFNQRVHRANKLSSLNWTTTVVTNSDYYMNLSLLVWPLSDDHQSAADWPTQTSPAWGTAWYTNLFFNCFYSSYTFSQFDSNCLIRVIYVEILDRTSICYSIKRKISNQFWEVSKFINRSQLKIMSLRKITPSLGK